MVQDTQPSSRKTLRDSDEIVKSLMAWRDVLWEKQKFTPIRNLHNDPFLNINTILYRGDVKNGTS